jgi:hypothetical protein
MYKAYNIKSLRKIPQIIQKAIKQFTNILEY